MILFLGGRRASGTSLLLVFAAALVGCGDSDPAPATDVTVAVFEPSADWSQPDGYYDVPWPSDLRLTADGTPDLTGFPRSELSVILDGLVEIGSQRPGFPTIPVGYFRFGGPLAEQLQDDVMAADVSSPVVLIDIDPDSTERGRLYATVARTMLEDTYLPPNTLAVAPRPGIVLAPNRTYAFVVTDGIRTDTGSAIQPSAAFTRTRPGQTSESDAERAFATLHAPLWETLEQVDLPVERVINATVFTTGDVVQDTFDLSEQVLAAHDVTIENLAVDPDDGADHPRFCELLGTVTYPQFQKGKQPFLTDGLFEIGSDGPVQQGEMEVPVVITIPKSEMPTGGYEMTLYFHGSGGYTSQVVDRGTVTEIDGKPEVGGGPSHVLAAHGFATAASALPVNPERLPGAEDIAYINFDNPKAFRDTFRQGVMEQRLFMEALAKLTIDPATLGACTGPTLPTGETAFHFKPRTAMGQSMGGMYTNMIGAVTPALEAVVPTGAGGHWSYFLLETSLVPGAKTLFGLLVDTDQELSFMHPSLHVLALAWEPAEPAVYMPRLARRPLEGHPTRHIYEPVGEGDSYFPTPVYDAVVLSYGHQQAGDEIWPGMQEALALDGLDGLLPYPVSDNRTSESGSPYTGVVVQYEGDGIYDPHAIAFQLDPVKYQYGCFLRTFVEGGVGAVLAPRPLGDPCTP